MHKLQQTLVNQSSKQLLLAWSRSASSSCSPLQVIFDCMALHGIATRLRSARFGSGALRLTNTKLSFALDTGGNPVSASPYVTAEANHLVEEFMLLANMRVAGIISRAFPAQALLRCALQNTIRNCMLCEPVLALWCLLPAVVPVL
jgi:hypothetical protein